MIPVILAEPEHPGNIGSVCRVMANFGCTELILINPKTPITQEARNLAKNAQSILNNARITDWSVLEEFSVIAATTGELGTDYNLLRTPLSPRDGAAKIAQVKKGKVALLFGRESSGLRNTELAKADFVISIPTHYKYPSMNLSHAVAIMLYEYYLQAPVPKFAPIGDAEKKALTKRLHAVLDFLPFNTEGKKTTQKKLWKNVFGRAMLTNREAFAVFGFLSAIEKLHTNSPTNATPRTAKHRGTKRVTRASVRRS